MLKSIDESVFLLDEDYRNTVLQCLLREKALEEKQIENFYFNWTEHMRRIG